MAPSTPKSCSSCRFRKIKCDRRQKLQEANAADDSSMKCTPCLRGDISCTFISAPNKQRLGKRIRALRETEKHNELLYGSQASSSSETSSSRILVPDEAEAAPPITSPAPDSNPDPASSTLEPPEPAIPSQQAPSLSPQYLSPQYLSPSSSSAMTDIIQIVRNHPKPGMFGIRGLSKSLLYACVAAYIFKVSPTLPIINPASFIPRLKAFLKCYCGELSDFNVEPLDGILVLAAACAGASNLSTSGPDRVEGSERKFQIRSDLKSAFRRMIEADNGDNLRNAGMDGLIACYIMAVVREEEKSDELFLPSLRTQREECFGLRIPPDSVEGVARMAKAMGLHIKSPVGFSSTGAQASNSMPAESEGSAKNRIWWCILGHDIVRAVAGRHAPLIAEDSFDHGELVLFDSLQGLPAWIAFESRWMSSMVSIAFLSRSIFSGILGVRARRRGLQEADCSSAIDRLVAWRSNHPPEMTWERQHQPDAQGFVGDAAQERAFKCRLRTLYLECLYHLAVTSLYYSLEEAGFRSSDAESSPISNFISEDASPPIATSAVRSQSLDDSCGKLSRVLERVEKLTDSTFHRLANLLPQAASEGMIRASPSILRNLGTTAIIWATEVVLRRAKEGQSREESTRTLNLAQNILGAVNSCDSSENTPFIVKMMEEQVSRTRGSLKEVYGGHADTDTSAGTAQHWFPNDEARNGEDLLSPFFLVDQSQVFGAEPPKENHQDQDSNDRSSASNQGNAFDFLFSGQQWTNHVGQNLQ